ncbi:hypothetical protein HY256_00285 [Candidatus Sumerlaeota bacterium]|nr:hypothetical protein [Candidatus Sumerlaeota bacterium]
MKGVSHKSEAGAARPKWWMLYLAPACSFAAMAAGEGMIATGRGRRLHEIIVTGITLLFIKSWLDRNDEAIGREFAERRRREGEESESGAEHSGKVDIITVRGERGGQAAPIVAHRVMGNGKETGI